MNDKTEVNLLIPQSRSTAELGACDTEEYRYRYPSKATIMAAAEAAQKRGWTDQKSAFMAGYYAASAKVSNAEIRGGEAVPLD